MITSLQSINKQSGVILIFSLVILLVITLLTVSGSQNIVMQEKMTFSSQDTRVANQSTEIGMINGEDYIENTLTNVLGFTDAGAGGLYTAGNAPTNVWEDATWDVTKTRVATTTAQKDVVLARYFIEYLGMNGAVSTFRIVSRGEGRSDSTERVIEGYYAKKF